MEHLVDDFRLALANLRRRGSLPVVIVLTLAVGIACTTAMFSVVRGVLLRPLPWPDSDRLAVIRHLPPGDADPLQLSQQEVRDLQQLLDGVEVGSYGWEDAEVEFGDRTEAVSMRNVTREAFEMLGAEAVAGRVFAPGEYDRRAPRPVMLGYELWQQLFGGDAAVVGRTIEVDGFSREIIGVMPPGFRMPLDFESGEPAQLWMGTTFDFALEWSRQSRMFPALARFEEGLSLEAARIELGRALDELRRRHGEVYPPGWRMTLTPVEDVVVGPVRPALLALFGAVFFVLLIACANVAHLLLAQNDARRHELAVKSALGARRGRLVRQLMLESLLLALCGGALGSFGAHAAVEMLIRFRGARLPRLESASVDPAVLLFGLAVSLATALLFGLLPAWKAAGGDLRSGLHPGRGTVGGLRGPFSRRCLMVAEVALATVLLAGAGLLVESLRHLARADFGFEPEGLAMAGVLAPRQRAAPPEERLAFWDRVRDEGGRLPGVTDASLTMTVPLYSSVMSRPVEIEDGAVEVPRVSIERAAPRIASTMGYRVLRGRDLAAEDRPETTPVALVNESLARYLDRAAGDAVGRRLRLAGASTWLTVVGVVGDVAHESLDTPAAPRLIVPTTQFPTTGMRMQSFMWLAVRTDGPAPTVEAVREAARRVDPDVAVYRLLVMDDHVAASALARYRFAAFVLGLFAAVALGLAVVGIYGLLSYLVHRGRREVGVRLALGARQSDIHAQVSRQGLGLTLAGLTLGIPAALAATRLLESLLYGLTPTEPSAFVTTAVVLLGAALLASLLPAQRATRVEPVEVLRSE